MFIEVPIIGTGTQTDPYRPKLQGKMDYSAYIPTGADGRPVLTKCIVCIPDNRPVPADGKFWAKQDALLSIQERNPSLDVSKLKVAGGS